MIPQKLNTPKDLLNLYNHLIEQRRENKSIITVCAGTGCMACGCEPVVAAFREALKESNLENEVEIKTTGCHGFCERGPLVVLRPDGTFYQRVKPADAKLIVNQTIKGGQLVKKLMYKDPLTKKPIQHEEDIPFYAKQMRLVFGKNGYMDPTS